MKHPWFIFKDFQCTLWRRIQGRKPSNFYKHVIDLTLLYKTPFFAPIRSNPSHSAIDCFIFLGLKRCRAKWFISIATQKAVIPSNCIHVFNAPLDYTKTHVTIKGLKPESGKNSKNNLLRTWFGYVSGKKQMCLPVDRFQHAMKIHELTWRKK